MLVVFFVLLMIFMILIIVVHSLILLLPMFFVFFVFLLILGVGVHSLILLLPVLLLLLVLLLIFVFFVFFVISVFSVLLVISVLFMLLVGVAVVLVLFISLVVEVHRGVHKGLIGPCSVQLRNQLLVVQILGQVSREVASHLFEGGLLFSEASNMSQQGSLLLGEVQLLGIASNADVVGGNENCGQSGNKRGDLVDVVGLILGGSLNERRLVELGDLFELLLFVVEVLFAIDFFLLLGLEVISLLEELDVADLLGYIPDLLGDGPDKRVVLLVLIGDDRLLPLGVLGLALGLLALLHGSKYLIIFRISCTNLNHLTTNFIFPTRNTLSTRTPLIFHVTLPQSYPHSSLLHLQPWECTNLYPNIQDLKYPYIYPLISFRTIHISQSTSQQINYISHHLSSYQFLLFPKAIRATGFVANFATGIDHPEFPHVDHLLIQLLQSFVLFVTCGNPAKTTFALGSHQQIRSSYPNGFGRRNPLPQPGWHSLFVSLSCSNGRPFSEVPFKSVGIPIAQRPPQSLLGVQSVNKVGGCRLEMLPLGHNGVLLHRLLVENQFPKPVRVAHRGFETDLKYLVGGLAHWLSLLDEEEFGRIGDVDLVEGVLAAAGLVPQPVVVKLPLKSALETDVLLLSSIAHPDGSIRILQKHILQSQFLGQTSTSVLQPFNQVWNKNYSQSKVMNFKAISQNQLPGGWLVSSWETTLAPSTVESSDPVSSQL